MTLDLGRSPIISKSLLLAVLVVFFFYSQNPQNPTTNALALPVELICRALGGKAL